MPPAPLIRSHSLCPHLGKTAHRTRNDITSSENVSCPLAPHSTGFGLLSARPAGGPCGSLANYTDRALPNFREGSMTLTYFTGVFLPAGAATREIPIRTNHFLISLLCNVREDCVFFSLFKLLIDFFL